MCTFFVKLVCVHYISFISSKALGRGSIISYQSITKDVGDNGNHRKYSYTCNQIAARATELKKDLRSFKKITNT